MLWEDISVGEPMTMGFIRDRIDHLSRNAQFQCGDYNELIAIANRLMDYLEFHQMNAALHEMAEEANAQNSFFRKNGK